MPHVTKAHLKPAVHAGPIQLNVELHQPVDIVVSDIRGNGPHDEILISSTRGTELTFGGRATEHGSLVHIDGLQKSNGEAVIISIPQEIAHRVVLNLQSSNHPVRLEGLKADKHRKGVNLNLAEVRFFDSVVNGRDLTLLEGSFEFIGSGNGPKMIQNAVLENVFVAKGYHHGTVTGNAALRMEIKDYERSKHEVPQPPELVVDGDGLDSPTPYITGMSWTYNPTQDVANVISGNLSIDRNQISLGMF